MEEPIRLASFKDFAMLIHQELEYTLRRKVFKEQMKELWEAFEVSYHEIENSVTIKERRMNMKFALTPECAKTIAYIMSTEYSWRDLHLGGCSSEPIPVKRPEPKSEPRKPKIDLNNMC